MSKVIWFDTETTGLNPVHNDIIQIAGIIEIDGKSVEEFNFKCRPHNPENIEQEALDTHGYKKEDIITWEEPQQAFTKLTDVFSKYIDKYSKYDKFIPAGHNVTFDIQFLGEFFKKCGDSYGIGSWMSWQPLDTMVMAVILKRLNKFNPVNMKLQTICNAVGIKYSEHDALEDVRASRRFGNNFLDLFLRSKTSFNGKENNVKRSVS